MTCSLITGPLGNYRCGCRDPRACHKDKDAQQLVLTPRCFTYHDRWQQQPGRTLL